MNERGGWGGILSLYEINLVFQEVDQNEKNFAQEMWLLKKLEPRKYFDFLCEAGWHRDVSHEGDGENWKLDMLH